MDNTVSPNELSHFVSGVSPTLGGPEGDGVLGSGARVDRGGKPGGAGPDRESNREKKGGGGGVSKVFIQPVEPLTEEEAREYELNLDKILQEIASFDLYFTRLGNERARLQQLHGEAKIKEMEIKTQLDVLSHYNDVAKSRISALKELKKAFK